jgi:hypothetical protein
MVTELETWPRKQRAKLSANNEVANAVAYHAKRIGVIGEASAKASGV